MSSHSTPDFLRPFLTREEYTYWNSHFNHIKSSCLCPGCTNPRDLRTTMIYEHRNAPVPVPNMTDITSSAGIPNVGLPVAAKPNLGIPVTRRPNSVFSMAGRPNSGLSTCHSNGFGGCFCSQTNQTGFVPSHCVLEKSALTNNGGRIQQSNNPDGRCATHVVSKRSASEYNVRSTRFVEKSSPSKRVVPPPSQRSPNCLHSTKTSNVHKEVTSKSLRNRLSEQYLCGDKSFDEIPANLTSKTIPEEKNTKIRSPPVLCDSTSSCGLHSEEKLSDSCPIKRKCTTESEHDHYSQRKRHQSVDNKVSSLHETQTLNGTIDLNDCWKQFLDGSVPVSNCGAGRKTSTGAQLINTEEDQAFGVSSAAEMLRVVEGSDQIPKDRGKSLKPKGVDNEVFTTAMRPVQRKLLNDIGSSPSYGYALDYDSLPKVVGVLSSNLATAVSGFRKQVR